MRLSTPATPPRLARRLARGLIPLVAAVGMAGALTACQPALEAPGKTGRISLIASQVESGYRFDTYVNNDYPCSISGYQTFTIASPDGSNPSESRPLFVHLRGGGIGFFSADGTPQPGATNKTQETPTYQRNRILEGDFLSLARADAVGYRFLVVSMCSHDVYAGSDRPDPGNPNLTDGKTPTVNGLYSTRAAIQYARSAFPSDDIVLHGTSAGSYGVVTVGWALQKAGTPATAIIADSGVLNLGYERSMIADGLPCAATPEASQRVMARWHPDIANEANQANFLVSSGRLTTPILQVWNRGDYGQCGMTNTACQLPDGSTETMEAVACLHEPLRAAIAAQGPTSRSLNMRLCVEGGRPAACDLHMPTVRDGVTNTDPAFPSDFEPVIIDWLHARLADD